MTYISYMFRQVAWSLISVLELMMLVRAVMSWFPQTQGGRLHQALVFFTEPIIMPFRALLSRIPALRGFPLDISFLLAYMVLIMLESML